MDTYYAGQAKGLSDQELAVLLLPVAGFLRYTVGVDDQGVPFALEDDPIKAKLVACGAAAKLGDPSSAVAFRELIADQSVMGRDLYAHGNTGRDMQSLVGQMLRSRAVVGLSGSQVSAGGEQRGKSRRVEARARGMNADTRAPRLHLER